MSRQLGIVIPTIVGREASFHRCYRAYRRTAPDARIVTVRNQPTCGQAWNVGAALLLKVFPDLSFLHFSADDLEPLPGWQEGALAVAGRDELPGAVLLNADGSVWNDHETVGTQLAFPRVPLLSVGLWRLLGPVPPIHYYSDVWLGRLGIPCPVVATYRFFHHWEQQGRIHDSEPDRVVYEQAVAAEAACGAL